MLNAQEITKGIKSSLFNTGNYLLLSSYFTQKSFGLN